MGVSFLTRGLGLGPALCKAQDRLVWSPMREPRAESATRRHNSAGRGWKDPFLSRDRVALGRRPDIPFLRAQPVWRSTILVLAWTGLAAAPQGAGWGMAGGGRRGAGPRGCSKNRAAF